MSIHLHKEVELLKTRVLNLGIQVEEQLYAAVRSVTDQDEVVAKEVIAKDAEIDRKEIEIEEECLKVLALHQPVAVDLRFMVGVLKINNDLERIGDLASNIAKKVPFTNGGETRPLVDFDQMAQTCRDLFKMSLDAMINQDASLANEVCIKDDEVDEMNRKARELVMNAIKEDPGNVENWLKKLSIARDLERIADHATNIAEDVIYMVNGDIARHHHDV